MNLQKVFLIAESEGNRKYSFEIYTCTSHL